MVVPSDVDPLEHLSESECVCVTRYVSLLEELLGNNLIEVRLFGSAARGDMWSDATGFRSDVDLLVLTRDALPQTLQEELINETYPLYLECGRQIGPQWRTLSRWNAPETELETGFAARVAAEGRTLFSAE